MHFANRNMFLIALGANGRKSPSANATLLDNALARALQDLGKITATSRFWQTPAFPPGSGPDFVNACAVVESGLSPPDFLAGLHRIEAAMGRVRRERWGQRVIDLDLLGCDDLVLPDRATVEHWMGLSPQDQRRLAPDELILPHPRLHERAFVLVPLAEVAPDWVHPVLAKSVQAMCDSLSSRERNGMRPI